MIAPYYEQIQGHELLAQKLESFGLALPTRNRLNDLYTSIVTGLTLDHAFEVQSVIATFPEQEIADIRANITTVRSNLNVNGEIVGFTDDCQIALAKACSIIGRHLDYTTPDGEEMGKGSFQENLAGFQTKLCGPSAEDTIMDCKLPTVVLWSLFKEAGINPDVTIRYMNNRFHVSSNFFAHPNLYIPAEQADDIPKGLLADFVAMGKGYRVIRSLTSQDIEPFKLPQTKDLTTLVKWLDIYFFVGKLIREARQEQLENPIQISPDEVNELAQCIFNPIDYEPIRRSVERYVNHLFDVPVSPS